MARKLLVTAFVLVAAIIGWLASHNRIGAVSFGVVPDIDAPFDGIIKLLEPDGSTLRLLMVHGIGSHCIGYSHDFISRIASNLGLKPAHLINDQITNYSLKSCIEYKVKRKSIRPIFVQREADDQLCKTIFHTQIQSGSEIYQPRENCRALRSQLILLGGSKSFSEYGYVRTTDYVRADAPDGGVPLRVYELTWDATTRWAKSTYVDYIDNLSSGNRHIVNDNIKKQ